MIEKDLVGLIREAIDRNSVFVKRECWSSNRHTVILVYKARGRISAFMAVLAALTEGKRCFLEHEIGGYIGEWDAGKGDAPAK